MCFNGRVYLIGNEIKNLLPRGYSYKLADLYREKVKHLKFEPNISPEAIRQTISRGKTCNRRLYDTILDFVDNEREEHENIERKLERLRAVS